MPAAHRRLQAVASALRPSCTASSARPKEPEWDSAGDGTVDDGGSDSNANLTLEEQLFVFDLQGFIVVENVLPPGQVDELNALIDAQGIGPPGVPEGSPPHASCLPSHNTLISKGDFSDTFLAFSVVADGSSGSRVRFGSAGVGFVYKHEDLLM